MYAESTAQIYNNVIICSKYQLVVRSRKCRKKPNIIVRNYNKKKTSSWMNTRSLEKLIDKRLFINRMRARKIEI